MAVGNRSFTGPTSPWQLHRRAGDPQFAVNPAGPKSAIPTVARLLPSKDALDYAHKFTSTTILLAGAVAFLLLGPPTLRGKLRRLKDRHIA